MRARVTITLKPGVLDPQGAAVAAALSSLGFSGVDGVRQGKVLDLDLAPDTTEAEVREMCERLLANIVIETYEIDLGP